MCIGNGVRSSEKFCIGNGNRRGSLLLPFLFSLYVRPFIRGIVISRLGCNKLQFIGGFVANVLACADDGACGGLTFPVMVFHTETLKDSRVEIFVCNINETVCMMFNCSNKFLLISYSASFSL